MDNAHFVADSSVVICSSGQHFLTSSSSCSGLVIDRLCNKSEITDYWLFMPQSARYRFYNGVIILQPNMLLQPKIVINITVNQCQWHTSNFANLHIFDIVDIFDIFFRYRYIEIFQYRNSQAKTLLQALHCFSKKSFTCR